MFRFDSRDRDIDLTAFDFGRVKRDLCMPRVDASPRHNIDFPAMRRANERAGAKFTVLERNCLMRAHGLNSLDHAVVGVHEQNSRTLDLDADHFAGPEFIKVRNPDETLDRGFGIS